MPIPRTLAASLLAVSLLAGGGLAFAHAGRRAPHLLPSPHAGAPTLTVLTYNVNVGQPGDPSTVAAIRECGADVVFLQETSDAWDAALRRELLAIYPHQAFLTAAGAGGQAVLSKLELSAPEELPGRWFPGWKLQLQSPLGPLQVLAVHLRPPLTGLGPLRGYSTNRFFRRAELQAFAQHLQPGVPTVVVGDFNEHESLAVRWLEGRGFDDSLAEFPTSQVTWHWPLLGTEVRSTLDHVMVSSALQPVAAEVREVGGSDHFPVRVALQRR